MTDAGCLIDADRFEGLAADTHDIKKKSGYYLRASFYYLAVPLYESSRYFRKIGDCMRHYQIYNAENMSPKSLDAMDKLLELLKDKDLVLALSHFLFNRGSPVEDEPLRDGATPYEPFTEVFGKTRGDLFFQYVAMGPKFVYAARQVLWKK